MKIALCITGQPRHWKKCYQSWFSVFNQSDKNIDLDIFFHFWDSNTLPGPASGSHHKKVDIQEQIDIINAFSPKKYIFEEYSETTLITNSDVNHKVPWWGIAQFESLYKVANLKRQYEIEHNIQYDVVVKLRGDLIFNSGFSESFNPYKLPDNWMFSLNPSTIYSIHSISDVAGIRLSDIFFVSDSLTFDHIALFKKAFKYLDLEHIFGPNAEDPPPERYFYWYLHSIGIQNHPLPFIEAKLVRDSEYLNHITKLGDHEIIL